MLLNGAERLAISLAQANIFDYEEYKSKCEKKGVRPVPVIKWCGQMGILSAARFEFPGDTPADAIEKFMDKATENRGCNGCGGGTVV
jgi:hypothetical protein